MKKLFTYFLSAMMIFAVGCSESFDDSLIWEEINSLKDRVTTLEQLCKQMNTNISSLQTIVTALQNNDYVTNISPITEDGKTIGYTITFSKSGSVTIYHGKDGKDGANGADGKDGVNGTDGKNGADGNDGADGVTPKLKIEDGYWYISYNEGSTWTQLGKATGEDGQDGADGDSMFEDVTYDEENIYITLTDGSHFIVPIISSLSKNAIWYTSSDGKIVNPYNVFGANILSNVYEDGKGVIIFDGVVVSIGEVAFRDCTSLTSITIPNSVTEIRDGAFCLCI